MRSCHRPNPIAMLLSFEDRTSTAHMQSFLSLMPPKLHFVPAPNVLTFPSVCKFHPSEVVPSLFLAPQTPLSLS